MSMANGRRVLASIAGTMLLVIGIGVGARASELPDKAQAALEKAFPGVQVRDVEREKEFGARYYGAEITVNGRRLEVEVSPDGVIGEVESVVDGKDVPAAIQEAIARQLKDKTIVKVERHERRASAKSGSWVPLSSPVIFYDVKYKDGSRRKSLILDESGKSARNLDHDEDNDRDDGEDDDEEAVAVESLPSAVTNAIQSQFSGSRLTSAKLETEDDDEEEAASALYEVKFEHQNRQLEAKVDEKGAVSEIKEHLEPGKLPTAISDSLKKTYPRAKVTEVEKVLAGDKPIYEVELDADGETIEVVLDADGKVLRHKVDVDEDDGDDDDDE